MAGRPPSRETTSFPAGNIIHSSSSASERMGAFGALELDHEPNRGRDSQQISRPDDLWQAPAAQRVMLPPLVRSPESQPSITPSSRTPSYGNHYRQQAGPLLQHTPHAPSTSNGSHTSSKRKHQNLSSVVSESGNSTDLARNICEYINEKIPYGLSVFLLITLSVIAFVLILIGCFNIPFCRVQPMIPIWLLVTGILLIITATLRIYHLIPSPNGRSGTMTVNLCCQGTEALLWVANAVWLTLGCIWVYGSKPYVHFEQHMFEQHYCDSTLYWTAFWTCTIYLVMICVLIIALLIIMAMVSSKEVRETQR
ncbi:unnamed protein product [Cylicocyclus nassatus]|uniref:Uncharacterized protein n=1 Tax=Cylicocyclus nassatus TaxID=53992 RepID=A0AA36H874_CYLNA|nr:unnamed protein product [Cylicocyclus nassatus]